MFDHEPTPLKSNECAQCDSCSNVVGALGLPFLQLGHQRHRRDGEGATTSQASPCA
jgi:hypothetical protein